MWFFKKSKKDKVQELLDDAQYDFLLRMENSIKKILCDTEQVPSLKENIQKLKDELADLQTTKKQEQRDIEHLIKCKEKKLELETKEKELALQEKYNEKLMELQKEYFEKVMAHIDAAKKDTQDIYKQILERLPNVNAQLNIGRKQKD